MLHMFGWNGPKDISDVVKPVNGDRNVNPEELAYWVRNYAGWLRIEYRVGGDIETLKRLIAAQYPVIIEGTTSLNPDDSGWPDDDLWAAHYLLLTGYDDATQNFTVQDTYHGPDQKVPYEQLESEWKPFNYLYLVVYLPDHKSEIQHCSPRTGTRTPTGKTALATAQAATVKTPSDAFAWFNLGSNLVYFERYDEANAAYDKARELFAAADVPLPVRSIHRQLPGEPHRRSPGSDKLCPGTYRNVRRDLALARMGALSPGDTRAQLKIGARRSRSTRVTKDALYALNFVGANAVTNVTRDALRSRIS